MDSPNPPAIPRPAATILLVRDGAAGLEVFMATRHEKSSFLPGLLVFPGGKVDEADSDRRILDSLDPEDRALDHLDSRIGGIREAFEEAGFLFARADGDGSLIGAAKLESLAAWRSRIHRHASTLAEMIEVERLVLAPRCFVPFAHWVTPSASPKRFDTRFYLAEAPHGQEGLHDDHELIDSRWVRPLDAIAEGDRRAIRLAFVTRTNLDLLARSMTVAEALAAAAQRPVVTVNPEVFESSDGHGVRIPTDIGYRVTEGFFRDGG